MNVDDDVDDDVDDEDDDEEERAKEEGGEGHRREKSNNPNLKGGEILMLDATKIVVCTN